MKTHVFGILIAVPLILLLQSCSSSTAPNDAGINNGNIYYFKIDSNGGAASYVTNELAGTPKLFFANAFVCSQPRNGQMLVVHTDARGRGTGTVSIVNSSGASIHDISIPNNTKLPVVLSPNGTLLFYTITGREYHLKNVLTNFDIAISQIGLNGGGVAFNKDGTRIAFYEKIDAPDAPIRLVVANVDGTGRVVLADTTKTSSLFWDGPAWSAASNRIYFVRNNEIFGGPTVWSISVDGSTPTRLFEPRLFESIWNVAVSPDGTMIAFSSSSHDTASKNIWVIDTDGKNLRQVATSLNSKSYPTFPNWSPNSRKLIYTDVDYSDNIGGGILHMIDVSTGTSTQLDEPNVYWAYWDY